MNNKVTLGLVGAIILVVIGYAVFNHPKQTVPVVPTPTETAATTTVKTPVATSPTSVSGSQSTGVQKTTPTLTPVATPTGPKKIVAFDSDYQISASSRPNITGIANVSSVALVIDDPNGVGIAGASDISVVKGAWSYTAPQALKPGIYKLHLIGGDTVHEGTLIIRQAL